MSALCLLTPTAVGRQIDMSVNQKRILNSIRKFKIKLLIIKTYSEESPNIGLSKCTTLGRSNLTERYLSHLIILKIKILKYITSSQNLLNLDMVF